MLEKGEISNTELYAFNRYKKLRKQITVNFVIIQAFVEKRVVRNSQNISIYT